MPLDVERGVVELGLVAILQVEDQCVEGRVGDELVVWVVVVLVAPLVVDVESLCLVEHHALIALEGDVAELQQQLLY